MFLRGFIQIELQNSVSRKIARKIENDVTKIEGSGIQNKLEQLNSLIRTFFLADI